MLSNLIVSKKKLLVLLISVFWLLMLTPISPVVAIGSETTQFAAEEETVERYEKGKVLSIETLEMEQSEAILEDGEFSQQLLKVKLLSGSHKGETIDVMNGLSGIPGMDIIVHENDDIVVYMVEQAGGEIEEANLADVVRTGYLKALAILFILLIVFIGAWQGIKALVALGLTILGLYKVLLPALMQGYSPLPVTVLMLIGVTLMTMLVVAGFSRKALAATLGTVGGVAIAGILAYIGGEMATLNGLATEEERMLLFVDQVKFNMRGLLFSGILIGALGAIMDVAMSVASAVEEVKRANPSLHSVQLMQAGMRVGRDIMGTMANTLILAYAGGSLPFLLLFLAYDFPAIRIINSELIASEIVRALAGSIGLIIAVPLTAVVAGWLWRGKRD